MTRKTSRAERHDERGRVRNAKIERRADYVLDLYGSRPSLSYDELVDHVRKEFGVGITAGEQAIARANERLASMRPDRDAHAAEKVAAWYLQLAEEARRAGKHQAARQAMDSYRETMGIGGPERVSITGDVPREVIENVTEMSEDELRLLAKAGVIPAPTEH